MSELAAVRDQTRKDFIQQAIIRSKLQPYAAAPFFLENQHPLLVNLPKQLYPKPEWKDLMPDYSIVGFAKAGTSQLFHILTGTSGRLSNSTAKNFEPYYPGRKEYCWEMVRLLGRYRFPMFAELPYITEEVNRLVLPQQLYSKFDLLYRTRGPMYSSTNNTSRKPNVNGCLSYPLMYLQLHYLAMLDHNNNPATDSSSAASAHVKMKWENPRKRKVFLIFRDPADWLWATWNFWMDSGLDANPPAFEDWASKERQYRSPELFHEIIASNGKTETSKKLLALRKETVDVPRTMIGIYSRENVFLGRNEDMLPDVVNQPGGFLDRVSQFTGLERSSLEGDAMSIRNCNANKGTKSVCESRAPGQSYEIAGGREMLAATRELIYLQFTEECRIWRDEFGITYPACLSALPSSKASGA